MDSEQRSKPPSNPLEGRYANYFKVGYNAFELIIDFGQCYADNDEAQLHTRIITNPKYGKELLITLRESLDEYEKASETIRD
jgi:hypothetical protein